MSSSPKPCIVFLSYNSCDRIAVETLARRIEGEENLSVYLDGWDLIPGQQVQESLTKGIGASNCCAVFLGPNGLGPWQDQEIQVVINRRAYDREYRVIPVLLPGFELPQPGEITQLAFLCNARWVQFFGTLANEQAFQELVWGIRGTAPERPRGPTGATECPYRGLETFGSGDSRLFFGRGKLTASLISTLRRGVGSTQGVRFLAVLGPSGSGKSSLVQAGLIAWLKEGAIEGSARWPVAILRPGKDPLQSLARAVVIGLDPIPGPQYSTETLLRRDAEIQDLAGRLAADPERLHKLTETALYELPPETRLVLVVDQFEEIFTFRPQDEQAQERYKQTRDVFLANLLHSATISDGRVAVILTMRSDFLGACAPFETLNAVISAHQEQVGPMSTAELRDAIERPAFLAGYGVEPALTERLLADMAGRPGALPLLQFALTEIWKDRDDRNNLTLRAYQELGENASGEQRGIQGILDRRADEIYRSLSPTDQTLCRWLFLRLVQPGEGTEDTKRRVPYREVLPEDPGRAVEIERLVQRLAARDARLITTEGGNGVGGAIEVAHEALIRGWTQLRRWVDAERQGLRTHRRLTEAAQEWAAARPEDKYSYLDSGARLVVSQEWAASHRAELNATEAAFLAASEQAKQQGEQTQLENERRLREAAEALAKAEKKQREEAQRFQLNALAGSLASQAVLLAQGRRAQSDLPALLALQAHRFNGEAQGREWELVDRALRSVLDLPHFTEVLPNQEDVSSLALSHDARWLACGCANGTLQAWDLRRTGPFWSALRTEPPTPSWTRSVHTTALRWVVAHPARPIVTCVAEDGAAFLVHLERTDAGALRLEAEAWVNHVRHIHHTCIEVPPAHVVYRHDGSVVFIAPGVGFDLTDVEGCFDRGQPPPRSDVSGWSGTYYGFSADGKVITSYVPTRGMYASPPEVHRDSIGIVPGTTANAGDVVTLNEWHGGEPRREAISFCPCTISPDGRWVVQISRYFTSTSQIKLWDVSGPPGERYPIKPAAHQEMNSFVFDRDSRVFASMYRGGWIGVWDLRRPTAAALWFGGWGEAAAAALSPGGCVMASIVSAGTQKPILVWPLAAADPSCAVLKGHRGGVQGLAFDPDGTELITYGSDDTVRLWNLSGDATDPPVIDLTRYGATAVPVLDEAPLSAYGPLHPPARRSGTLIAIGSPGHCIAVAVVGRDGEQFRERVLVFRRGPGNPEPLVLQPPLESLGGHEVHSPVILSLRFGGKGNVLHVCEKLPVLQSGADASDLSGFGIVRSWDLSATGAEPAVRLKSWGVRPQVALDDRGTLVSALSITIRDRYNPDTRPTGVSLWDAAEPGKPPSVLACAGEEFTAVAIDGHWICASGSTGVVWAWDRSQPDAEPVARQAHFGPVRAVALGPDDNLLAAGGDDGTIAVWLLTQAEARPILLSGLQDAVNCLAFSPDGRLLAAGCDDGTVRIWIIDLELLAGLVKDRVQRNLTPAEWRRYVGSGVDYQPTCPNLPPGDDAPSSPTHFAERLKDIGAPRLSRREAKA